MERKTVNKLYLVLQKQKQRMQRKTVNKPYLVFKIIEIEMQGKTNKPSLVLQKQR